MSDRKPPVNEQIEVIIEAEVKRAVEPYRRLGLGAEDLDEMERALRFALRHDPTGKALVRAVADDPTVNKSGNVPTGAELEALRAEEAVKKVGS